MLLNKNSYESLQLLFLPFEICVHLILIQQNRERKEMFRQSCPISDLDLLFDFLLFPISFFNYVFSITFSF